MRGTFNYPRLVIAALALLVAAPAVAGCSTQPSHKEIEAIGVVTHVEDARAGADIVETFTFDDARIHSMRYQVDHGIEYPGVWPNPGDLLIAGSKPGYWLLVATPRVPASGFPPGCFGLGSQGGYDTETTVELDFGVTLQKAPDFNPTGHGTLGRFGDRGVICLDRQGRVTQIDA